jgi:hypothetical protein
MDHSTSLAIDPNQGAIQRAIAALDHLLRGDATRLSVLRIRDLDLPLGGLALVTVGLGIVYGLCMGLFSVFNGGDAPIAQLASTMIKLPLLFVLTLAVTFPSLYAFNALIGSRLEMIAVLRLLVATLAVILAIAASLGPIVAFFSVSTTSYNFILIFNVAVLGVAGVLGLRFLLRTQQRMSMVRKEREAAAERASSELTSESMPSVEEPVEPRLAAIKARVRDGALDATHGDDDRAVKSVFRIWIIVFALVGAQMSWVLRPFLGMPGSPFTLFCARESNFFDAVFKAIGTLLL